MIGNSEFAFSNTMGNFQVTHSCHLTMHAHVLGIIRAVNIELRHINCTHQYLTEQAIRTLHFAKLCFSVILRICCIVL